MNHTQITIPGAQSSAWHPQEEERKKRNQKIPASAEEAKLSTPCWSEVLTTDAVHEL
jgi:hypothetical protein